MGRRVKRRTAPFGQTAETMKRNWLLMAVGALLGGAGLANRQRRNWSTLFLVSGAVAFFSGLLLEIKRFMDASKKP